jgi:hypothetical protein
MKISKRDQNANFQTERKTIRRNRKQSAEMETFQTDWKTIKREWKFPNGMGKPMPFPRLSAAEEKSLHP